LTALPPIPTGRIGHSALVDAAGWGVLANDRWGCCVFAGAAHETLLWNREAGRNVPFNDTAVLADYSAVTGFDPRDPSTDQGTNMRQAMLYRKATGVRDQSGARHRLLAFVAIDSIDELKRSIYLFGAAAVGFAFPASAMDQFNEGAPWDVVSGSTIDGGHYVPVVAYDSGPDLFYCVTWGRLQPVTPRFLARYMDEAFAPLSEERLKAGKSLEGFDLAALQNDLAHIGDTPSPVPSPVPSRDQPSGADVAFRALAHDWSRKSHTGENRTAAKGFQAWELTKEWP
jgi:hypothetical protein